MSEKTKPLNEQDFLNILTAVDGHTPDYEALLHIIALYYLQLGRDSQSSRADQIFHKGEKIIKYMDVFKMLNTEEV